MLRGPAVESPQSRDRPVHGTFHENVTTLSGQDRQRIWLIKAVPVSKTYWNQLQWPKSSTRNVRSHQMQSDHFKSSNPNTNPNIRQSMLCIPPLPRLPYRDEIPMSTTIGELTGIRRLRDTNSVNKDVSKIGETSTRCKQRRHVPIPSLEHSFCPEQCVLRKRQH